MRKNNFVRGDGNGGFDANVQKAVLRKWGLLMGFGLLLVSGFASQIGEEVWDAMAGRSGDLQRIEALERQVAQNREDDISFRAQLRSESAQLRKEIAEIHSLLIQIKEGQ